MWRLTPHQFKDRMGDVKVIHDMLQGEKNATKGRVQRDRRRHRALMTKYGVVTPEGW